jgi:hypothetical protein
MPVTKGRAPSAEDADMEDAAPTSAQQPLDSQGSGDPMEEAEDEDEGNGLGGEEEAEEQQRVRIVSFSSS